MIRRWLKAAGGFLACRLGKHPFRRKDPTQPWRQYNVWICENGCPGCYWTMHRDYSAWRDIFIKIRPKDWARHGITDQHR
jgi:hypothetical protein